MQRQAFCRKHKLLQFNKKMNVHFIDEKAGGDFVYLN